MNGDSSHQWLSASVHSLQQWLTTSLSTHLVVMMARTDWMQLNAMQSKMVTGWDWPLSSSSLSQTAPASVLSRTRLLSSVEALVPVFLLMLSKSISRQASGRRCLSWTRAETYATKFASLMKTRTLWVVLTRRLRGSTIKTRNGSKFLSIPFLTTLTHGLVPWPTFRRNILICKIPSKSQ